MTLSAFISTCVCPSLFVCICIDIRGRLARTRPPRTGSDPSYRCVPLSAFIRTCVFLPLSAFICVSTHTGGWPGPVPRGLGPNQTRGRPGLVPMGLGPRQPQLGHTFCQVLGTALVGRAGSTKGLGRWVVAAREVLPVGPWAYLRDGRIARTLGLRLQYYLRQRCTAGTQDRAT